MEEVRSAVARHMTEVVADRKLMCLVGFTGSGQAMRKDPTRSRHVYQVNEDLD